MRDRVIAAFNEAVFDRADLLHVPTMPTLAPSIDESDPVLAQDFLENALSLGTCTRPFTYLGLPALSVPAGLSEQGLPSSFQLVGPPFTEELLFRVARAYERETGWTSIAPPLSRPTVPASESQSTAVCENG